MSETEPLPIWRLLGLATTFIATALAILYSIGAVLIAGAIRQAHLSIRDALPSIPTHDFLARGIAVCLGSFGVFLLGILGFAYTLFVVLAWHYARRSLRKDRDQFTSYRARLESMDETDPHRKELLPQIDKILDDIDSKEDFLQTLEGGGRLNRVVVRGSLLVLGGFAVALCFYARPYEIPGLLLIAVVVLLAYVNVLPRPWLGLPLTLIIWASGLVTYFYYPTPLSQVLLRTDRGSVTSGLLIAQTPANWYVGAMHDRIVVVPDRLVREATIKKGRKPTLPRRTYAIIWSWLH